MISVIAPPTFGMFWFLIGLYVGIFSIYAFAHFIFPNSKPSLVLPIGLALLIGIIAGYWGFSNAIQMIVQNSEDQHYLKVWWYGLSKIDTLVVFMISISLGLISGILTGIRNMDIANGMATGIYDALISIPISLGLLILIGDIKAFNLQGKLTSFITTVSIFGGIGLINSLRQKKHRTHDAKEGLNGFMQGFILGWVLYHILQII